MGDVLSPGAVRCCTRAASHRDGASLGKMGKTGVRCSAVPRARVSRSDSEWAGVRGV